MSHNQDIVRLVYRAFRLSNGMCVEAFSDVCDESIAAGCYVCW